jgi:3-phenylpropionate/trans-cinnamate dioxygenase ferredoxin reductase subunit
VAQAIDTGRRIVTAGAGESFAYSRLILCTGGRARPLPVPGGDRPGVHVLRTVGDAQRLGAAMRAARRVAVVGGGWIGLEAAAAARRLGLEVVLLEAQERLCPRVLPELLSAALRERHVAAGTDVRTACGVRGVSESPSGRMRVECDDGRTEEVDLVVAGIGLVPNDGLARAAGLAVDGGVLVDAHCRTSDPFVYAAGDVAVVPVGGTGIRVRLESWQNAQDQGICAARNAVGVEAIYDPLPWFWSDQHGFTMQILGFPLQGERCVVRGDLQGAFTAFFLTGPRVVAAVACDAPRDARAARRLIERRIVVREEELADPAISLAAMANAA